MKLKVVLTFLIIFFINKLFSAELKIEVFGTLERVKIIKNHNIFEIFFHLNCTASRHNSRMGLNYFITSYFL